MSNEKWYQRTMALVHIATYHIVYDSKHLPPACLLLRGHWSLLSVHPNSKPMSFPDPADLPNDPVLPFLPSLVKLPIDSPLPYSFCTDYNDFLKYVLDTTDPDTILKIVSPAPK